MLPSRSPSSSSTAVRSAVRVRVEGSSAPGTERAFSEAFTIGRGIQASLHVDSGRVSRIHAEVGFEEEEEEGGGAWVLRDAGSTNGTYHEGRRVERVVLAGETVVRLGREGPVVTLSVVPAEAEQTSDPAEAGTEQRVFAETDTRRQPDTHRPPTTGEPSGRGTAPAGVGAEEKGEDAAPAGPGSVSQVIRHYFDDEGEGRPAGERTMMIRQAFREVQEKQQRTYGKLIGAVAALLVIALGFALWQQFRLESLEGTATMLFAEMKEQDLRTVQLLSHIGIEDTDELEAQLAEQAAAGRRTARRYEGYVEELGLHRALSDEEREIYRVARIFNESEFAIPAGFIRAVQQYIGEWKRSNRFERAVRRAEQNSYTPVIVETFRRYGLPPEFFYLALQESDFDPRSVGPPTNYGRAKGMWQFIPSTGRAYGLVTGPYEAQGVFDPQDERHDFEQSTEAAARYLADIYTELAQASGLLAMASYNWGEHRVVPKLNRLQEGAQQDFFADLPRDPQRRSYWRFLNEYEDRMPEQTKDYVLHIFAAAVIGQNPRLFGFDLDNPLQRYIEDAGTVSPAASLARP